MYIKLNESGLPTGDVVSIDGIRMANPSTSVPSNPTDEQLEELGYGRFKYVEYPAVDEFTAVTVGDYEQDQNGVWFQDYVQNDISLEAAKAILQKRVGERRWAVESGGINVGGIMVDTSIEAQNRISSVVLNGTRVGMESINFKSPDGTFNTITMVQMTAIADAIAAHVQNCFTAEAAHCAEVAALTSLAEVREYLTGGLLENW